jgi:UDP-galactose transporter B1
VRAASSVSPRAQVFIFVTISKFGALTCSIIGLARKITTLVASIIIYGHSLNMIQVR